MPARTDWILHVDLDQFIAAVEILRRPELRGKPVIVGGSDDPTRRRVVVATASYEARAFGVRSGMPLRTAAKRCPHAVFLRADHAAYEAASRKVMATLRTFPGTVEELGWDEAFVGVHTHLPCALAADVQRAVAESTGLSCSIGIGDNTHRAKLATGFAKPAGIYQLTADNWKAVMFHRPTTALWGIGPKMTRNLAELGITTVAQLANADPSVLAGRFGPTMGRRYWRLAHGDGDTTVTAEPRVPRSRSRELTFSEDLTDYDEIAGHVAALARERADDAAGDGRTVIRVAVKLRFAPYFTQIRSRTLPEPTSSAESIERAALEVLDRFDQERSVRLVGVRVEFS